jgi:D-alanine-D-alanine ligase
MRILVLMGGSSPERMVSLSSGEAVAEGLDKMGHQVIKMDPSVPAKVCTILEKIHKGPIGETPVGKNEPLSPEKIQTLLQQIQKYAVDLVFPVLHGGWGEDGRLQAVFEIAGIPYVGCNAASSALAMNKHLTKRVVSTEGVATPDYYFIPRNSIEHIPQVCREFGYPLVIKPNASGSAVGVSILQNAEKLPAAMELARSQNDDILIERYIAGRELTVGILEGQGLAVIEVVPKDGFYDYKHKYTSGQTEYICPADIGAGLTRQAIEQAAKAFRALGCEVFGRVDLRLDNEGNLWFLEVNTIPGMTASSLLPKAAAAIGMSFPEMVHRAAVISMSLKRG